MPRAEASGEAHEEDPGEVTEALDALALVIDRAEPVGPVLRGAEADARGELKKAKEELDAMDLQLAGLNLINYESGPGKKILERKLEQSRNVTSPTIIKQHCSSFPNS